MPRPKPARSIGEEENLARRIRRELQLRNWTPAELAQRMTDAGCAIGTSSVYKILDEEKPRAISVDEFVAVSKVFNISTDDLLTPVEVVGDKYATELVKELDAASGNFGAATEAMLIAYVKLLDLAAANQSDLFDYVRNHHWRSQGDSESTELIVFEDHGRRIEVDCPELVTAMQAVPEALLTAASKIVLAEQAAIRTERGRK